MNENETWVYPFTKEQIDTWKKQFESAIYVKQIGEKFYVYRPLSTIDFRKIRAEEYAFSKKVAADAEHDDEEKYAMSQDFTMELVVTTCVLYPENYKDVYLKDGAGVLEQLNALIFIASGYTDSEVEPIKF